uniref:Uncharacterized protein n=1 Tax=Anguilla anguilla TaxID=7936 RepID=A0A0E9UU22_ANGAN
MLQNFILCHAVLIGQPDGTLKFIVMDTCYLNERCQILRNVTLNCQTNSQEFGVLLQ